MSSTDGAAQDRDLERSRNTLRLIYLWEILDTLISYAEGRPGRPGLSLAPEWLMDSNLAEERRRLLLQRWRKVFAGELEVIQAVRNSAAHAVPVDDQTIREALRVARRLVRSAQEALGYDDLPDPLEEPGAP
jgi:hypothetical protein